MADNGLDRPVIGVIFDGTGYGTDGTIWGGEFLVGDYRGFERAGHLARFRLPGGDKAVREPARVAIALLTQYFGQDAASLPLGLLRNRDPFEVEVLMKMTERGLHAPLTSSMGRLFDAYSALLGVCEEVGYEGQAAIELEQLIAWDHTPATPWPLRLDDEDGCLVVDHGPWLEALLAGLTDGRHSTAALSRAFHESVVHAVVEVCLRLSRTHGLPDVVLSGGVFLNQHLLIRAEQELTAAGLRVHTHRRIPPTTAACPWGRQWWRRHGRSRRTQRTDEAAMDEQRVRQAVDAVVGQLRTYVPDMAPYFEDDRPLGEYAKALSPTSGVAPEHAERQELIAKCVRRVLRRAFGPGGPADAVTARDIRAVNIVDHHQVLNHPLLLGTNIIANAGRLLSDGPAAPIVTLSCSNVNPSNHYMRNGFRFRGVDIPYFSAKEHRDVMYYLRPRAFDFVERLHSLKRWSGFAPADQDFLEEYQHLLNGLDHSASPGHRDQLATVVHGTWPRLFSEELRPVSRICSTPVPRTWPGKA